MSVRICNPETKDIREVIAVLNQLAQGRTNAHGTVTLTANAASTTVTAITCGEGSAPLVIPTTANAAAEIGAGTMYVSTISNGSFVIAHANNAQTDRTFRWVALG
jgi:hypothetical protein